MQCRQKTGYYIFEKNIYRKSIERNGKRCSYGSAGTENLSSSPGMCYAYLVYRW